MRAAFSATPSDQNKFIEREVKLFQYFSLSLIRCSYRLQYYKTEDALQESGYSIQKVSNEEVREMFNNYVTETSDFFSLDFEEATRQVPLFITLSYCVVKHTFCFAKTRKSLYIHELFVWLYYLPFWRWLA